MRKLITFAVPCYNSEAYMHNCINSLLNAGDDIEIIIINDGSKDSTPQIADEYAKNYPHLIRVIHQENGGHGEGVNQGIRHGTGIFYKVVDSDDRLDPLALESLLQKMREHVKNGQTVDMYVTNYVYDYSNNNNRRPVRYDSVFPVQKIHSWKDTKPFGFTKYLMMHSLIYRTELLREINLELPKHTFYVDNLYLYLPMPWVKNIFYMDLDLYYYYIGREDQSVNEKNMIKRIDQQILVTKLVTDAYDLSEIRKKDKTLFRCMFHELSLMYTISTVFLYASKDPVNYEKSKKLWNYLKNKDSKIYKRMMFLTKNIITRLPGPIGRSTTVFVYKLANKIFKFN